MRRLALGLRQKDVAIRIGCDHASVTNWEKGHHEPSINHLRAIVAFLGYDPFGAKLDAAPEVPYQQPSMSRRLLAYRRAMGLSQRNAARVFGVDPSTLARWERGEREPQARYLKIISSAIAQPLP